MYRIGIASRPNSASTSHLRTARTRADNTLGETDETADRTAFSNVAGAFGPTSKCWTANFGNAILTKTGASNETTVLFRPRTGLAANPAQRINPFRFPGFVAAY